MGWKWHRHQDVFLGWCVLKQQLCVYFCVRLIKLWTAQRPGQVPSELPKPTPSFAFPRQKVSEVWKRVVAGCGGEVSLAPAHSRVFCSLDTQPARAPAAAGRWQRFPAGPGPRWCPDTRRGLPQPPGVPDSPSPTLSLGLARIFLQLLGQEPEAPTDGEMQRKALAGSPPAGSCSEAQVGSES